MGTVLLIIAFIVEVTFAIYCITTNANQRRVRNYLRIGALVAFVFLALVSVIQWGFRWYLLALLLLIWGVLGAWALIRKNVDTHDYKAIAIIGRAVGTLLLVFVTLVPVLIFPQTKLPPMTGTHPIATASYTYTDPNRTETFTNTGENREVNVEFWYPNDDGGPYPLILFSHGAFGLKTSNTSTFMDLASNGYVVCSIDHPYHSFITIDAEGKRALVDQTFLQEVMNLNSGKYDEETGFRLHKAWMALRIADIQFVLDTLLAKTGGAGSDPVYQLIDHEKIGLMGHSLGGESSAQVARERNDIGAVVNLDSNLEGEYLEYVDGKYVMNDSVYPVPLLTIVTDSTERLIDAIPDANTVVALKHVTATAPIAYEVNLPGTDHMSVTDLPLVSPFLVSMINSSVPKGAGAEVTPYATLVRMNDIVLRFFNAYLKSEGEFTPEGAS